LAEYGREHLSRSGETVDLRRRHADFYLAVARGSDQAWQGAGQLAWMKAVESDLDNVRSAMAWAIEQQDAEQAQLLAGSLGWFWWMAGGATEGVSWLSTAVALPGDPDPSIRARALVWTVFLAVVTGGIETYKSLKAQAIQAAELAEPSLSTSLLLLLAIMENVRGDRTGSAQLLQKAERRFASLETPWLMAARAFSVGLQQYLQGDVSTAERYLSDMAEQAPDGFLDSVEIEKLAPGGRSLRLKFATPVPRPATAPPGGHGRRVLGA
jgi:hypothetical protein